jgi:hypothetical protein
VAVAVEVLGPGVVEVEGSIIVGAVHDGFAHHRKLGSSFAFARNNLSSYLCQISVA